VKVLLVNSEHGLRGGEHQTVALGLGLRERGCEVCLCVREGSPIIDRIPRSIPVVTAPFEPVPSGTLRTLHRCITGWRPGILHAQTSRAHTHLRLARLFVKDPPPLVVSRRVAFPISRGIAGWLKYRAGVAHYIPISVAAARSLRDGGVPGERMTIVPSGIPVERFATARGDETILAGWGVGGNAAVIGTVAAFEMEKGYGVLLDAVKRVVRRHAACRFVWLGNGGGRKRLDRMIDEEGLGGTVITSTLSAPLETVLPHFRLFVLPSLSEGLSTALIAALAAGIPAVASDTGGIPEVIHGGCGVLVPPGDAGALARAITDLLEDEGKRRMLSAKGRERARFYDITRTIDGTLGIYRSVLGEESRSPR
jgi:glycosyltransferase involved in cell wall biosynthesis